MSENQETSPPRACEDPRSRSDFEPGHYPGVNGHDAPPPAAAERNDRIKLEFLAVYYALNLQHARLIAARNQSDPGRRREEEETLLREIEKVLIVRDQLEDAYAPLGVIAEPIVREGFTVDLKISFGDVDAAGRRRSDHYTITAYAPIPLPEGIRFEDLPLTIDGPDPGFPPG